VYRAYIQHFPISSFVFNEICTTTCYLSSVSCKADISHMLISILRLYWIAVVCRLPTRLCIWTNEEHDECMPTPQTFSGVLFIHFPAFVSRLRGKASKQPIQMHHKIFNMQVRLMKMTFLFHMCYRSAVKNRSRRVTKEVTAHSQDHHRSASAWLWVLACKYAIELVSDRNMTARALIDRRTFPYLWILS